jgi:hypothetical protein
MVAMAKLAKALTAWEGDRTSLAADISEGVDMMP